MAVGGVDPPNSSSTVTSSAGSDDAAMRSRVTSKGWAGSTDAGWDWTAINVGGAGNSVPPAITATRVPNRVWPGDWWPLLDGSTFTTASAAMFP